MGHFIQLTCANFTIPETPEVIKALHDLNTNPKYQHLKDGRGWSDESQKETRWFSWMPENYHLEEGYQTVEGIFNQLGFGTKVKDNSVSIIDYYDKRSNEDIFLAIVAPFVKDGSFLQFEGEDGAVWRYDVIDGKLQKSSGIKKLGITRTENVLKD